MTAEARDRVGHGPLVLRGDLPPLLGVQASCDLRRADEIREQDGELAALRLRTSPETLLGRHGLEGSVDRFGQRGAAIAAEFRSAGVLRPACGTTDGQGCPAFTAEALAIRIVASAAWAVHACAPREPGLAV